MKQLNSGHYQWTDGPPHPSFDWRVVEHPKGRVVSIIDRHSEDHPSMSVTNGVEYVIEEIVKQLGYVPPYWVYRDTEHNWDLLQVGSDGEFLGYGFLGERVREEHIAIERVTPS